MSRAYEEVSSEAERLGTTLRLGAFALALRRVAEAWKMQGNY